MFLSCYAERVSQAATIANALENHDAELIVESVQVVNRVGGAFPYEVLFKVVPGHASNANNVAINRIFGEIINRVVG